MENFILEFSDWVENKFPSTTNQQIVEHLRREVKELKDSQGSKDPVEAADCLLVLLHHARINGYDLLSEAKKKFEIVKVREWGKPDEMGVIEHV